MHEAQMHERSSFVTLTYDDIHCAPSLNYLDFQLFMKRTRAKHGAVRFFMCGEYGEQTCRPHFHCLVFGHYFDRVHQVRKGSWYSSELAALWPFGFSSVGDVTFESASYVAQYVVKKCSGSVGDERYSRLDLSTGEIVKVVPEFGHMSLKPGIGFTWFEKYWRDCYMARDGVVLKGGRTVPNPRYYDKLLNELDYSLKDMKDLERYRKSKKFASEGSPERLAVREHVHKARIRFYNRRSL
jgi:hypothetical protein